MQRIKDKLKNKKTKVTLSEDWLTYSFDLDKWVVVSYKGTEEQILEKIEKFEDILSK